MSDRSLRYYDQTLEALEKERQHLELVMKSLNEEWDQTGPGLAWMETTNDISILSNSEFPIPSTALPALPSESSIASLPSEIQSILPVELIPIPPSYKANTPSSFDSESSSGSNSSNRSSSPNSTSPSGSSSNTSPPDDSPTNGSPPNGSPSSESSPNGSSPDPSRINSPSPPFRPFRHIKFSLPEGKEPRRKYEKKSKTPSMDYVNFLLNESSSRGGRNSNSNVNY